MSDLKASMSEVKPLPYHRSASGPLYITLAESLQSKIMSGEYPPGSALPSVTELSEQYHVANMTARQAIGLLEKKGFVSRRHGKGTFVQEGAGKLLIGILVGPSITEEATYFYRAIVNAMREAVEARGWISRTYDGLTQNGHPKPMTSSNVKQLRMDLNSQVFHGFVEISPGVKGLAEMEAGFPLPKVKCEPTGGPNDIEFDLYDFGWQSVTFLASRGITDIVYMRPRFETGLEVATEIIRDLDGVFDATHKLGLPKPSVENIILEAAPGMSRETDEILFEHAISLFRERRRINKKFGLIVNDDIGMRTIALAMAREQVNVPGDCEIICYTHEKTHHHYGVPVHRYEQQLHELASKSLAILEARIYDEPLPPLPVVVPGFVSVDGESGNKNASKGVKQSV